MGRGVTVKDRARQQPPGSVIIPIGDQLRHPDFVIDLFNLATPPGSGVLMRRSASITDNLNMAIMDMPPEHEWAWILGDDHRFAGDLLVRLLEQDVEVVVPLGVKRTPPYTLTIAKEESVFHDERLGRDYPGWMPYQLHEVPAEMFTVVASGSAGMLVRRHVLDDIGFPYFESTDGVYLNEDYEFCRKIRAAGIDIWCDPDALLGHIGQAYLWPEWRDGTLMVKIDHGGLDGENEIYIGLKAAEPVPA
jgi:hypothetical protein